MNPKEKASDLVHRYRMLFMNEGEDYGEEILVSILSQKCALIAVDEILKEVDNVNYKIGRNGLSHQEYWKEVKQEIEKQ